MKNDLKKVYSYFNRLDEHKSQAGFTSGGETTDVIVAKAMMAKQKCYC